jgi:hypothetical protein
MILHHILLKGTNSNWAKNLRTFGEIGIVYTKQVIKNTFTNHGDPCMFIGYAEDHTSNVVARAMVPHFHPIQPPEPDEISPPNFANDNASIQFDAPAPDSPEP